MEWLAFRTNRNQINQDTFAAAMLRHMVQLEVGETLSDDEYENAVKTAIQKHGLKQHSGQIDLRKISAGSISVIGDLVSREILAGRESGGLHNARV